MLLIWGFVIGGDPRRDDGLRRPGASARWPGSSWPIREHFAGFRSHTTLLAGAVAVFVGTLVAVVAGKILLPVLLAVGLIVFAAGFVVFRRGFRERSGGLSFR